VVVAEALQIPFAYSNRIDTYADSLFPIEYRVLQVLRPAIAGRRTAVVTDAISAGSAVGDAPAQMATAHSIPLRRWPRFQARCWPQVIVRFARKVSSSLGSLRQRGLQPGLQCNLHEPCPAIRGGVDFENAPFPGENGL
jgi:hypothetical protein